MPRKLDERSRRFYSYERRPRTDDYEGKLIINKSSWHYRLMSIGKLNPYNANNLCSYIRRFVAMIILWSAIIISPFAPIIFWMMSWDVIIGFLIGLPMYTLCVILGVGFLYSSDLYSKGRNIRQGNREILYKDQYRDIEYNKPKEKRPNILSLWFKAFHEKTCPMIEFETTRDRRDVLE